ncbi:hypothetical protein ACFL2V_04250, partial [Pseudomonadota bacterium]
NSFVLWQKRIDKKLLRTAIAFLNEHLSPIYREISGKDEEVVAEYICTEDLGVGLKRARTADLAAQFTTVGPHRDDLMFSLNGRALHSCASRGEYRSLLLALKLIELKFYGEKSGNRPLLLLDDVFSELDFDRQKKLTEAIKEHQTIITATHIDDVIWGRKQAGLQKKKVWEFSGGKLKQEINK